MGRFLKIFFSLIKSTVLVNSSVNSFRYKQQSRVLNIEELDSLHTLTNSAQRVKHSAQRVKHSAQRVKLSEVSTSTINEGKIPLSINCKDLKCF